MNIREKIKPYVPFIFLFFLMLLAHISVLYYRDDIMFRAALDQQDGWIFLKERWSSWTSRVIIEGVMIYILDIDNFPLWKTLNCLLFLLLAWSVSCLTGTATESSARKSFHWFIVGLILLYPYGYDMGTAGWAATTMNYFWPLVFGLFAMTPIRRQLDGTKCRWYDYAITIPFFVYAANAEQGCVILLATYGSIFFWQLAVHKTFRPFFLFMTALGLLSLGIIIFCPGNSIRMSSEFANFKTYPMLGFYDKLDLALSSAMTQLIGRPNLLFFFFSLMLAVAAWRKYTDSLFRLIASFPFACGLIFGMLGQQAAAVYPELSAMIRITQQGVITPENYISYKSYLPLLIMGSIIICILISFYLVYHDRTPEIGFLAAFVLLLGLATRAMMAFTPTVWASNTRTNIYQDFSMIILCCFLYTQTEEEQRKGSWLKCLLGLLASFSFLIQFTAM